MRFAAQTGGFQDAALGGLVKLRARDVLAVIGRFTSRDPIGFWGGINLFGYVRNGPVGRMDPAGFLADEPCGSPSFPERAATVGVPVAPPVINRPPTWPVRPIRPIPPTPKPPPGIVPAPGCNPAPNVTAPRPGGPTSRFCLDCTGSLQACLDCTSYLQSYECSLATVLYNICFNRNISCPVGPAAICLGYWYDLNLAIEQLVADVVRQCKADFGGGPPAS
jgi:RHS repeat-associated protein